MVSQAQIVDRIAPSQSTPSVVSRHSHSTRRHRPGRSHHGGSGSTSSNDFPIFRIRATLRSPSVLGRKRNDTSFIG
ncbi:hypothetical protein N7454_009935 [Penicillium verhagenii]|nr:hypothetical protein N7454_009935 [Penicillium verhagenii]